MTTPEEPPLTLAETLERTFCETLNVIMVGCVVGLIAWTLWFGIFGDPELRLEAAAISMVLVPVTIGIGSGLLAEKLRSRQEQRATNELDLAASPTRAEIEDPLLPKPPSVIVRRRWGG